MPSIKGYKSLNKYSKKPALTFELYMKRKCQLIVLETETPRFSKYLILQQKTEKCCIDPTSVYQI